MDSYSFVIFTSPFAEKEDVIMDKYITYETRKGYPTRSGYMGYITEGGKKILFATEEE